MKTTRFPVLPLLLWSLSAAFSGSALALQPAAEADQTGMSAEMTLRLRSVGNATLSPDGSWVLYTKRIRDMEDEDLTSTSHIWRVRVDGTQRRQLTYGTSSATSPAWHPDGDKIAFLTSRGRGSGGAAGGDDGPKRQVYFMYVDGGEAWQVTEHEESVSSFRISPDGKTILFTSTDPLSKEEKAKRKKRDDARVVDQDFRMSHLWVWDLETAEATRLTEGEFTVGSTDWSPDSSRIVYETRRTPKVDDRWASDVWVVSLADKEPRKLYENVGPDSSPRWSPDGRTIAVASNPHGGTTTWYNKLYLFPAGGGDPKILLNDFDLDFQGGVWSPDSATIYFSTGEGTTSNLYSVDVASNAVGKLTTPKGGNFGFELSKDGGRWVWVHSESSRPGEIYTAGRNLGSVKVLTEANGWLREENVPLAEAVTIRWKNSDGQWIEGVLTRPVGYQEGKRYPLIVNPHGGPSGAVTESFSSTNQFFAANGFMIFQPNFRGSSNYGQEFLNANRNQWGIRDYDDIMTGVDYVVEQGWADMDRMVCYGWSYGGYMSFWTVTQTDRFKAVSPGAGLSNLYSMYSTTDIPGYLGWFFGTPWDSEDVYRKLSAIRHAKQVVSPVLILHGAEDARVPPTQAVEFYQALKDLGKEVELVLYPREGHGIREPRHQLDRLRRYLKFFTENLGMTPVTEKTEETVTEAKDSGGQ